MAVALRGGLSAMGLLAVTSVGAIGVTRASQLQMDSPFSVGDFADDVEGRQPRQLQATASCTGTSVYVSSLLLSDTEGCYEFEAEDGIFVSADNKDVIAAFPISNATDAEAVWVAGSFVGSSSLGARIIDPHCHSHEYTSEVDNPGDVALWLCDVDNSGVGYTEVTTAEFSTACGCPGVDAAPSDIPTSAPSSVGVVPPTGASTTPSPAVVDGGEGVTTAPAPSADAPTETAPVGGPTVVSTTPSPAVVDGGEGVTTAPAPSADAPTETAPVGGPTVVSTTPSPAVVDSGAGATAAPGQTMDLETPSPVVTDRDIGTMSPAAAPTELCPELDSFSISVDVPALSDLEGCYIETGAEYEEAGGHFFSMDGVTSTGAMAVFPGYADALSTDARWFVGFFAESATNITVTCVSAESPAQAHPADASWHCDVAGDGKFPLTPDGQVSFDCGCPSTSSMSMTSSPSTAPAELMTAGPTLAPAPTTASAAPTVVMLPSAEVTPAPTEGSRAIEIEESAAPTSGLTGFNAALNSGPSTFSRVSMVGIFGSGVVAMAVGMGLVAA